MITRGIGEFVSIPAGPLPPIAVRTSTHTAVSPSGFVMPVQPAALELLTDLSPVISR